MNIKNSLDSYIKPEYLENKRLSKHLIDKDYLEGSGDIQGKIYVFEEEKQEPNWAHIVNQLAISKQKVIKKIPGNTKALILFKLKTRVVALSFSHGKTMIKEGYLETDFGLKTSRKVIDNEQVKSIKSLSINEGVISNHKHARKAIPAHSQLNNSNLNIVNNIKGAVRKEIVKEAKITAGGRDQIQLQINESPKFLSKIAIMLEQIIEIYSDEEKYADNFYWSNEVRKENNPKIIQKLEKTLADKIRLMIKNIADPSKREITESTLINIEIIPDTPYSEESPVTGFYISGIGYKSDYVMTNLDDIEVFSKLAKFLQEKEERTGIRYSIQKIINKLKGDKVYYYMDGEKFYLSALYSSIYFQTTLQGDKNSKYMLLQGKWYAIPTDFYDYIATSINEIPDNSLGIEYIPFTNKHTKTTKKGVERSEGVYNENMSTERDMVLFDRQEYPIPADKIKQYNLVQRSSVEPCDLLSYKDDILQLIHVKIGRSGNGLSHLLSQAYGSSALYKKDPDFLEYLNEKITEVDKPKIQFENKTPVVVLVCIVKPSYIEKRNSNTFPFLSAVNIVETVNRIKDLGFNCHLIKVPDNYN